MIANWPLVRVGDLEPYVTSGSRGWARYYSDHGAAFVRITNLSRNNVRMDCSEFRCVSVDQADAEATRTTLLDDDVLMSITADIGIIGLVSNRVPKPAYINQHVALVRFDSQETCPTFWAYALSAHQTQATFRALTDAGAKAGINLNTVRDVAVCLPPSIEEQRAIAESLSDADALIESLERLIAKKRAIKQGAMQDLLSGKRRLPGFSGEWRTATLGQFLELHRGYDLPSHSRRLGSVPIVMSAGIGATHDEARVDGPGVVTGRYGTIGQVFFIDVNYWPLNTTLYVREFRGNNERYIYYLLHTVDFATHSGKSGVPGVNRNDIHELKATVPTTTEEQRAIATVLTDMDNELDALSTQLAKAHDIKRGMMQQLLTGRIRLV